MQRVGLADAFHRISVGLSLAAWRGAPGELDEFDWAQLVVWKLVVSPKEASFASLPILHLAVFSWPIVCCSLRPEFSELSEGVTSSSDAQSTGVVPRVAT